MNEYIPSGYVRLHRAIAILAQVREPKLWTSIDPSNPFAAQFLHLGVSLSYPDLDASGVAAVPLHESYHRARASLRDLLFAGAIASYAWRPEQGLDALDPKSWALPTADIWLEAGGIPVPQLDLNSSLLAIMEQKENARTDGREYKVSPGDLVYHPPVIRNRHHGIELTVAPLVMILINENNLQEQRPRDLLSGASLKSAETQTVRGVRQPERLMETVDALRKLYPDGRPERLGRKKVHSIVVSMIGQVSFTTFDRARELAWTHQHE